jgi:adenylate cyclase
VGNLLQAAKYSRSVRRAFEEQGEVGPAREVPMPGPPGADSRIVVPAVALGQLVGVLVAESTLPTAFTDDDEAVLVLVASVLAGAVEALRGIDDEGDPRAPASPPVRAVSAPGEGAAAAVRFFAQDGSTFLDGEYLIKGVAGRILWALLQEHAGTGRTAFTNREVRRDPSLDLPGFKDNFESRLILLKRRLDERAAPVRIERTGRGRFRLDVSRPLTLTLADP